MKNWKALIMPALLVVLAGIVAHDRLLVGRGVPQPAAIDGKALGRVYGPIVLASLSDAWLVAAQTISDGKSTAEAQKALQDSWQAARVKAFTANVAPQFSKVLAEGAEPTTPAEREAVAKLWRDFAKGLKGGR